MRFFLVQFSSSGEGISHILQILEERTLVEQNEVVGDIGTVVTGPFHESMIVLADSVELNGRNGCQMFRLRNRFNEFPSDGSVLVAQL